MDSGNNRIQKFAPGSAIGETIVSTTFNTPRGFHLDSIGNIYIADQNNNRVLLFRCGKWQISLSLPLLRLFINFFLSVYNVSTTTVIPTTTTT